MMMYAEGLRTTVTGDDSTGVLRLLVGGDVDMSTAPTLDAALVEAMRRHPRRLEVDLTGVTYFSSAGLQVLLAAQRHAGDRLRVVGAGRPVRRLLQALPVHPLLGMARPAW